MRELRATEVKYCVGQKVRSGFCKLLGKNSNELFGQTNNFPKVIHLASKRDWAYTKVMHINIMFHCFQKSSINIWNMSAQILQVDKWEDRNKRQHCHTMVIKNRDIKEMIKFNIYILCALHSVDHIEELYYTSVFTI